MMDIFLDSGAFTVWKSGGTVNLQAYIDFIHAHKDKLTVYANLDDMADPVKTWENQVEMEKQGLKPLPVYHIGEDTKYLKKCMEYEYFAVGGNVLKGLGVLKRFFDQLFTVICPKENGFLPTHKIHGFALTAPSIVASYPWYSADSTSWVMYGKYGIILISKGNFREEPYTIFVSTRSKAQMEHDAHINTVSPIHREYIMRYIEKRGFKLGESEFKEVTKGYKLGENEAWADRATYSVEIIKERGLCNDHAQRDFFNLQYYLELERSVPEWPWPWEHLQESLATLL